MRTLGLFCEPGANWDRMWNIKFGLDATWPSVSPFAVADGGGVNSWVTLAQTQVGITDLENNGLFV